MRNLVNELKTNTVVLLKPDQIIPYDHIITNENISEIESLLEKYGKDQKGAFAYIQSMLKGEVSAIKDEENWEYISNYGYDLFSFVYKNEKYYISIDEEFGCLISKNIR